MHCISALLKVDLVTVTTLTDVVIVLGKVWRKISSVTRQTREKPTRGKKIEEIGSICLDDPQFLILVSFSDINSIQLLV